MRFFNIVLARGFVGFFIYLNNKLAVPNANKT